MLSLPDDWDYSINCLVAISKESIKSIRNILHELENNKYLIRTRMQGEHGRFYYDYSIYETPYDISPYYQKGYTDSENAQNVAQINTNKKEEKDDTKIPSFFVPEEHNRLTLELVDNGYINENDIQIFCYDDLFNRLLSEDNSYKDLIRIANYIVYRVLTNKFKDENGEIIENKFAYFKSAIENNIEKIKHLNEMDLLWEDNLYADNEMER